MEYIMKSAVSWYDFDDAFSMNRSDSFSYHGRKALFEYLEQLEEDCDMEIELDVIALCCEYSEYTIKEALAYHALDTLKELEDRTTIIYVDDPPGRYFDIDDHGEILIIIQDF